MKRYDLTIVIPAYCEERRIGRTLDDLSYFLRNDTFFSSKEVEVLVVAADAPDNTAALVLAKKHLFTQLLLLRPGVRVGKGRDVQYGMLRASGNIVIFMDADLATPLHHLRKFYDTCSQGSDIVIGTRNLLIYRSNLARGIFAIVGNTVWRVSSGLRISDMQCGFKMFNNRAVNLCFSHMTILDWGFDAELLTIAKINNLKVTSYPIQDWQHMPYTTYADGVVKIGLRTIKDIVRIYKNRLLGKYTVATNKHSN